MSFKRLISSSIVISMVISMSLVSHASEEIQLIQVSGSDLSAAEEMKPSEKSGMDLDGAVAVAKAFFSEYDEMYLNNSNKICEKDGSLEHYMLDFHCILNGKKENLSVSVDVNTGEIRYFSAWDDGQGKRNNIAKVTKNEARKIAEDYIEKVGDNPDAYALVSSPSTRDNTVGLSSPVIYQFTFARILNGIMLRDCSYSISINAASGKVVYFSRNKVVHSPDLLPSEEGLISEEDALENFVDALDIQLQYILCHKSYGKSFFKPAYAPAGITSNMVDALSGDVMDYDGTPARVRKSSEESETRRVYPLSDQPELKTRKIDRNDVEDIVRGYREIFEELTGYVFSDDREQDIINCSSYDSQWSYEYARYSDEMSVQFSFSISKETGIITGLNLIFNRNHNEEADTSAKQAINFEQGREKAIDAMKKLLPDQYGFFADVTDSSIDGYSGDYYYVFQRMHNGIPTPNYTNINIRQDTGALSSFMFYWEDIEFAEAENIISKEEATELYSKTVLCNLRYYFISTYPYSGLTVNEKMAKIVYNFDTYGYIDASTGRHLNWSGEEILGKDTELLLTDHPAKRSVELLLAHGFIDGENVDYDRALSRGEVIRMLSCAKGFDTYGFQQEPAIFTDVSEYDSIYSYLQNAVNKKVFIPDGDIFNQHETICKEEYSILLANLLGYSDITEHSELFILDDVANVSEKGKGSVAVCKALDILPLNGDDAFDGSKPITLAEAAITLYKALYYIR
ncbi:MAG: hypothetical protein GX144_11585 [Clostridiaceae bacterium]|nr:hypothetical protein [Clostridiaceae bacterium]